MIRSFRPIPLNLTLMIAGVVLFQSGHVVSRPASAEETESATPEVGEPQAAGMIKLMQDEIVNGLRQRRIESTFAQFQRFAKGKLDTSAAGRGGEVTGICRLNWYDHLLRNIIQAPAEAEDFTRKLHQDFLMEHEGLDRAFGIAADKLDLAKREPMEFAPIESPEAALDQVRRSLLESQMAFAAALEPLSRSDISRFASSAYSTFTSGASNGHTLPGRGTARFLCQMLQKSDRDKMCDAAVALVPLANPELLDQLGKLPAGGSVSVSGATGPILQRRCPRRA